MTKIKYILPQVLVVSNPQPKSLVFSSHEPNEWSTDPPYKRKDIELLKMNLFGGFDTHSPVLISIFQVLNIFKG